MREFLTTESAREIKLPIHPLRRHKRVLEYLADTGFTGAKVLLNPKGEVDLSDGTTLIVNTLSPIYGRRTLLKTAGALEVFSSTIVNEIIDQGE